MLNPVIIFKMKELLEKFQKNHPKVMPFLRAVGQKGVTEGTIIEAKIIFPDETQMITNIQINEEDLELIRTYNEL